MPSEHQARPMILVYIYAFLHFLHTQSIDVSIHLTGNKH